MVLRSAAGLILLISLAGLEGARACEFHDGAFGYAHWIGPSVEPAKQEPDAIPAWYVEVLRVKAERAGRVDPVVEAESLRQAQEPGAAAAPSTERTAARPSFSAASQNAAAAALAKRAASAAGVD